MVLKSLVKTLLVPVAALLLVNSVQAHWSLDNEASQLSFVTIKADHVAEVHTFDVLSGSIGDSGDVKITIELASVNTLIQIRNERMQALLFETNLFPEATITGHLDIEALAGLSVGSTETLQVEFELTLHGMSNSMTADLLVSRLDNGLVASTLKPIIVTANSFGLIRGVEQLREVAGLPSISNAVSVSFTVVFRQGH
ncbi:MAG: YceI family protein [Proteobacteria bacterium]|nr:YceI family protein [Pseudomonadota bacterium]